MAKTMSLRKRLFLLATLVLAVSLLGLVSSKKEPKGTVHSSRLHKTSEDPNAYIRSQMLICYRNGGRDDCYKNVATVLFSQFSLREILDRFAQTEKAVEVFSRCHEVAHFLARMTYEEKKNIPQVFSQCTFTCHGGCYHGAMEAYLMEKKITETGDVEERLRNEMATVCGKSEDYETPLTFRECVHGLGHAAMFVTEQEVPQALHLCDALSIQEEREGCYSGVFHENSSSSTNTAHPAKYIRKDNLLYPCNILDERYLSLCYRYQSSYFAFFLTNHDWGKTMELCKKVPEKYWRECFQTIGTNQVGFTQDFSVMRANCDLAPTEELKSVCISGVVISLAGRYINEGDRIMQFCLHVNEAQKESCFRQMGVSIVAWSKDTENPKRICSSIGIHQYSTWCTSRR